MAVWKFHSPFLDDVKQKGLFPALLYKTNEVVERLTAGLDIEDLRSVMRGDPAPRPNPRVKPHADGFWFHMRPTYYHNLVSGLYPSFRLGWLSTYFLVFETLTGVVLMVFYTPSPLVAYENMLNILSNVPFGRLMRDLHKLGAEAMVWVVFLHMARTYITGNYKKPRQFTWFTGVLLLIFTLFLSFFGYLLPWDQLSLWAVTIGASMAEAIPGQAGVIANLLLRGGPQFGADGMLRAYLIHVLFLPLLTFVFFGVHYYKVVIHGHSLPPEAEPMGEDTAKRVPTDQRTYFMPDVLTRELLYTCLITFLLVISCVTWYHAPLEPHADPLVTPLHTTAPWYFLWLQGMLKVGDKFIFGIIAPGVVFNGLMVIPYLEVGPSRRYGDRRLGLTAGFVVLAALAITSFMGTAHFGVSSSPDQEVVAELVPQTEPGPLRKANWDELTPGSYRAEEWQSAPTPTLRSLLHTYQEEMDRVQNRLKDGQAFMIIEPWQPDLKKITFRVIWEGGPKEFCLPDQSFEFCQTVFLNRLSDYGHGE